MSNSGITTIGPISTGSSKSHFNKQKGILNSNVLSIQYIDSGQAINWNPQICTGDIICIFHPIKEANKMVPSPHWVPCDYDVLTAYG